MKIVLTLEEVRILVVSLGLNSGVIDLVLATADVSGCIERLKRLSGDQVATQGKLSGAD
jgi:hypothetical protein